MGTGVYKWPLKLTADIAARALAQSEFETTSLYVVDEMTRRVYQQACKKYLSESLRVVDSM